MQIALYAYYRLFPSLPYAIHGAKYYTHLLLPNIRCIRASLDPINVRQASPRGDKFR